MVVLILLGLFAGALTTTEGLGGGLLMTIALAALWDPTRALATAAPALLVGNSHRVFLYRHVIGLGGDVRDEEDARQLRRLAMRFVVGGAPGAFVGGLLAVSLPEWVLQTLLVVMAGVAIAREFLPVRWLRQPQSRWARTALFPMSFAAGLVTATSGGGGLILGPLMLTAGLKAERFVVTGSLTALAIHIARIAAYGAGGLVDASAVADASVLAGSILAGNALGKKLRTGLNAKRGTWLTYAVLVLCLTLSLAGLK